MERRVVRGGRHFNLFDILTRGWFWRKMADMRQTNLFTKTRRDVPKDESALNAKWLLRAGFIGKEMAGVYAYLPLGWRVIKKIEDVVRRRMEEVGALELLLPALHRRESWEKTGRWTSMTDLYHLAEGEGRELALGPTHEEAVTPLVKNFISSYQDLPIKLYQIQTKFRRELRSKSGLLRGREFIMKDLYSFHANVGDLENFYQQMLGAYQIILSDLGLDHKTFLTLAGGGEFASESHEFQTITPAGEDTIYRCTNCQLAINKEIKDQHPTCPQCGKDNFVEERAIEVANIFRLGSRFSDAFDLTYQDQSGKRLPVVMGCFGFGISRVMGAIVEMKAAESIFVWPQKVAPFLIHLLELNSHRESKVKKIAEKIYQQLTRQGIEVLWDDRQESVGVKFSDADLFGLPYQLIIGSEGIARGQVELRNRQKGTSENLEAGEVVKLRWHD